MNLHTQDKHEFILQYVLNRAQGHTGGLHGRDAAIQAEKAWDYALKVCKENLNEKIRSM